MTPENSHTSNVLHTEQVVFESVHRYAYIAITKKRGQSFEKEQMGIRGRFVGTKGKWDII